MSDVEIAGILFTLPADGVDPVPSCPVPLPRSRPAAAVPSRAPQPRSSNPTAVSAVSSD